MKIGQLCFFRLSSPAEQPYGTGAYGSRYQGQRGPTASRSYQNFHRDDGLMALLRKRGNTGMTGVLDITSPHMLRDAHLLLVPSTVTIHEIAELVKARVRGSDMATTGAVRLGRHSRLLGPFQLTMEDAVDADVPMRRPRGQSRTVWSPGGCASSSCSECPLSGRSAIRPDSLRAS